MASKRQKAAPKQQAADPRGAAVDAALRLAALRDWDNITMAAIADEAGLPLSDLSLMFDCREDIVIAYDRRVDADVLAGFSSSGSERDQVFDILMERFERLNRDRAALCSILQSALRDPKQMVTGMPNLMRSMAWMLEGCGIETQGWKGAARVAGLAGVYAWTLRIWKDDESPDLAKTMAALDKTLGRAEKLASTLGL